MMQRQIVFLKGTSIKNLQVKESSAVSPWGILVLFPIRIRHPSCLKPHPISLKLSRPIDVGVA
jgi:hypothetical protein